MAIIEGYLDIKEYIPGQIIKSWCGDVYEVIRVVKASKETVVQRNGKLYNITWGHNKFFLNNDDTDSK